MTAPLTLPVHQQYPGGPVGPVFDINVPTDIMVGQAAGDLVVDELDKELRLGPVLHIDGGNLKMFVSDTVLRSKKNAGQKAVIRKLNLIKFYNKKGSRKPGAFKFELSQHLVNEIANNMCGLGNMMNACPKATYADYVINKTAGVAVPLTAKEGVGLCG